VIEAAMLFALGFLCAALMALAAVPALARRADRLARKRAEAAFPLSLSEIAADRDHLRAGLAVQMRGAEQEAERGFAAKAEAMRELGRRDMTIGRLDGDLAERKIRIAGLEDDLAKTRGALAETQAALTGEQAAHGETAATLDKRIADLASLERSLEEVRSAAEKLRVAQVEDGTRMMVLQGKNDEYAGRLAATEERFSRSEAALSAMTAERDGERVRADAFGARAAQAEAGLAAADARAAAASAAAHEFEAELRQERAGHAAARVELDRLERALAAAAAEREAAMRRNREESAALQEVESEREGRVERLRAELLTLQGALSQARADRAELRDENAALRKAAGEGMQNAALRQEIVALADRLMALAPKREAAE
jgi:chromosome segregation ATPase